MARHLLSDRKNDRPPQVLQIPAMFTLTASSRSYKIPRTLSEDTVRVSVVMCSPDEEETLRVLQHKILEEIFMLTPETSDDEADPELLNQLKELHGIKLPMDFDEFSARISEIPSVCRVKYERCDQVSLGVRKCHYFTMFVDNILLTYEVSKVEVGTPARFRS